MHQIRSRTLLQRCAALRRFSALLFLLSAVCLLSNCGSAPPAASATPALTPTLPAATPTPAIPTLTSALLTYKNHTRAVIGVSWSPDGTQLASCSDDGTVQVWSAHSGKLRWKASIGTFAFAVAWSPDGKEIAGGAQGGVVSILDAASGKQLAQFTKQNAAIEGISWSPDSRFVASGSQD